MTPQEMLLKHKLSLLQLAEQLQNIRQACKMMGVSRQHYYDIKERFEQAGVEGLHEKERKLPRMPNQTPQDTEERIVCLLYTSPSPRDGLLTRMPSSA